jgi:hypothetical protein
VLVKGSQALPVSPSCKSSVQMKMHCCAWWLDGVGGMEEKLRVINWKGLKKKRFHCFPLVDLK